MGGEVIDKGFSFGGEADFGEAEDFFSFFQGKAIGVGGDANDSAFDFWRREKRFFWYSEENLRCAKERDRKRKEAVFAVFDDNTLGDFFLYHEDDFVGRGVESDEEADDFSGDGVGDIAKHVVPLVRPPVFLQYSWNIRAKNIGFDNRYI